MPIGANAGQNLTEPKEKPPNGGVLPLAFFHWRLHGVRDIHSGHPARLSPNVGQRHPRRH
ncbi:hypothetical protein ELH03_32760 (plasmid) [Rhizobium beringeri]|uniref:Uncharacterized protein n=1 Tax=Rhizobium beringeri TaxID=3019934 RepID=A0ABY1XIT4_9HYPH|nr:hypothetical protein ELH03_32760 [Rhizobium beringeri]